MLNWTEQFETGHPLIDTQHKMLITYINRLEGISRNTNPTLPEVQFCLQLVAFMETYIAVHFSQEENCMHQCHCPVYEENKSAHRQFLVFYRQFKDRFETEGCNPQVLQELHESCQSWIQDHIMQIDVQIRPCVSPAENRVAVGIA
jgi:hemerythrin